ncbi:MAG: hypothetical protein ACKVGW_13025 [Verrucomicrobiia bacterium]
MNGITLFAVLLITCSLAMIVNPETWTIFWQKFSKKKHFHLVEILTRILFAAVFFGYGNQTKYPVVMNAMAILMIAAAVGLLVMGSSKHRKFAMNATEKHRNKFRAAGFASLAFGSFLLYASLN